MREPTPLPLPSASQHPHERDGEGRGGRGGEETALGKPRVQGLLTEGPWQPCRSDCRCPRALLQPRARGRRAARTRRTLSLTAARVPKHAEGYRREPLGQLQHRHVCGGSTGEGSPAPSALPKGELRASRHPNRSRVLSADPGVIPPPEQELAPGVLTPHECFVAWEVTR